MISKNQFLAGNFMCFFHDIASVVLCRRRRCRRRHNRRLLPFAIIISNVDAAAAVSRFHYFEITLLTRAYTEH